MIDFTGLRLRRVGPLRERDGVVEIDGHADLVGIGAYVRQA